MDSARRRLVFAGRIWPTWRPAAPPPLGAEDARLAAELFEVWTRIGAVRPWGDDRPPTYQLVTHPSRPVRGKCHGCGLEHEARWVELLAPRNCPRCRRSAEFVMLARLP